MDVAALPGMAAFSTRSAHGPRPSPWRATIALVGICVALAACSAATSHGVLSFLFDGVPDPNAPSQDVFYGPPAPPRRLLDMQAAAAGRATIVLHEPYAGHRCTECHVDRPEGGRQLVLNLQLMRQLRAPAVEICVRCHKPPAVKYRHAPALLGQCLQCHHPHQSQYEHLLLEKTARALCAVCHTGETWPSEQAHAAWSHQDCAACHDPHAADNRDFLRADWERFAEPFIGPPTADEAFVGPQGQSPPEARDR